jgi:hypothetical protein
MAVFLSLARTRGHHAINLDPEAPANGNQSVFEAFI